MGAKKDEVRMMWGETGNQLLCVARNAALQVIHTKIGHHFLKLAIQSVATQLTGHKHSEFSETFYFLAFFYRNFES